MRYKLLEVFVFMLCFNTLTIAQTEWNNGGEIENTEIIIEKDKKIELPHKNRNFEKIPPKPEDPEENPLNYNYKRFLPPEQDINVPVKVNQIEPQPLPKSYGNYVKGGIGTYLTSYGEVFLNNKRSKNYTFGLHGKHRFSAFGPVDGTNSATSNNEIGLFGNYFTKKAKLSASMRFNRNKHYFYGYEPQSNTPNRDSLGKELNRFNIGIQVQNQPEYSNKVSYQLEPGFSYFETNLGNKEALFDLNSKIKYPISKKTSAKLEALISISQVNTGNNNKARNLAKLKPSLAFELKGIQFEAGLNLAFDNESVSNVDEVNIYPIALASYSIKKDLKVYGKFGGDIERVTLSGISQANPYLAKELDLLHTNKELSLAFGLKGQFLSKLSFDIGLEYEKIKNQLLFVNDSSSDLSRFINVFETESFSKTHFYSSATFHFDENLHLGLIANFFGYNTKTLAEAYHKPTYSIKVSGTYNLRDKIYISSSIHSLGGLKAANKVGETINLEGIFDVNLKIDYLFNSRLSVFVDFENLFNQNYQYYYRYPSRGLFMMGGVSYAF